MPPLIHVATTDRVELSFEQTVPRALVHKRSLENVLLTEVGACAEDRFYCAGRVPAAHRFFNDAGRSPHTDILFFTELGRQASLAISHQFLRVGPDDVIVFEGSEATLAPGAWTAALQASPNDVLVEIHAREITRCRHDVVSRVVAEHVMWIGGEQVFLGTGAWTVQPAALFQRLRRTSGCGPVATGTVPTGTSPTTRARLPRASGDNVVISPVRPGDAPDEWAASLIVDPGHPYFFDHACDHVPSMLLLEGCAQMALAVDTTASRASVASYDLTFGQFVECDRPATLTALPAGTSLTSGERRFSIAVTQSGIECGWATIGLVSTVA
jgi:2-oxo-3-(phosphooxy)propyl 3-oxoalkanoate synthase